MRPWILSLQLAVAAAAALVPPPLSAYTLAPSLVTLRSAGGDSSTFLRLENKQARPAAVEITIHEHRKDLDGNSIDGGPADDEFIVYPAQLVMIPGDEAAVQVRWIGDAALAAERAFTFTTREVPIPRNLENEGGSGIRIDVTVLVNYEGRIYVAPPGAKPKLVVESIAERPTAERTDAAAAPWLELVLANQGTAHQVLSDISFTFVPLDAQGTALRQQAVTVAGRDLPGTRPHLLAGERRRLSFPRPAGLPAGGLHVTLSQ
jgi:fimbrial chaperone protein